MAKAKAVPTTYTPAFLHMLDKRSAIAQTMHARYDQITNDLGGADNLSYVQRSLVTRYLWSEYWIQQQEQAIAEGREVDIGKYIQAVNGASGLAAKLGLQRVAKDVPNLADYLAAKGGSK